MYHRSKYTMKTKHLEENTGEKSLWLWSRQSVLDKTPKVGAINEKFWYVELHQN